MAEASIPGFWAVIPAGGAGTRLWPLSRAGHPKFLHDLTGGGRSLLQATLDRVTPLVDDRVVVVTGAAHVEAVRGQLPALGEGRLLAEPSPRDSMAAIGWAAAVIERLDPEAVIGSFAADHAIPDAAAFAGCVRDAVAVARGDVVVTIGIEPSFPSTAFGYIRLGEALPSRLGFAVASFVEKPDAARAAEYLATGEYRWNAGMFVVKARVLLDLLGEWHPELAAGLRALAAAPERLGEIWPGLERIAIDHAVAEPAADAGRVAVVPGSFGWDDVGDFASLAGAAGEMRVLGSADQVLASDSSGLVVPGAGRLVAVLGLDDVVVVDTPDAVLVTTRSRAQEVKGLVDRLRAQGRTDLL